jgi:putative transcription factor
MRCEVCGQEIHGQPYYRIIEGGKLVVCGQCAHFGTKEWDPSKPSGKPVRRRLSTPPQRSRPRSEIEVAEQMELIENYGELIRKTRQKKGMSIEDFAKKLNEKESVLKKLEKSQFNPPMTLIQKVSRELNITILEPAASGTGTVLTRPMGPRTLGDLIKIKSNDEDEKG